MSKCNKVKNPCKICLGPVTQKNGLTCHGPCESWLHYGCLNYSPGRIKDIKTGIIKVSCPCPDCKTSLPKEYRTDEHFSCTNIECPANRPPKCENPICPTNKGEKMNQTSEYKGGGAPYALGKCGINDCKQHSNPNVAQAPISPGQPQKIPYMMASSSDACITFNRCPSGCSTANVSGDMRQNNTMEGMPLMYTMEQMCNTVSLLAKQINDLMNKMQQNCTTIDGGQPNSPNPREPCTQKGPRALCPKPCYCPNNPAPAYRR